MGKYYNTPVAYTHLDVYKRQGLFGFTTLSFAPYVVFAYANIAVSVICALAGIFIFKAVPGNSAEADWSVRGRAQQPFSPELEEILPEPLAE